MVMRHPLHSNIKAVGYFESGIPVSHHELTMRKHGRYFDLDLVATVSFPASESMDTRRYRHEKTKTTTARGAAPWGRKISLCIQHVVNPNGN